MSAETLRNDATALRAGIALLENSVPPLDASTVRERLEMLARSATDRLVDSAANAILGTRPADSIIPSEGDVEFLAGLVVGAIGVDTIVSAAMKAAEAKDPIRYAIRATPADRDARLAGLYGSLAKVEAALLELDRE